MNKNHSRMLESKIDFRRKKKSRSFSKKYFFWFLAKNRFFSRFWGKKSISGLKKTIFPFFFRNTDIFFFVLGQKKFDFCFPKCLKRPKTIQKWSKMAQKKKSTQNGPKTLKKVDNDEKTVRPQCV